ncbi:MAG: hypothetical protein J5803_04515 [Desulfovibrio sp.]|nr:hypothetical protein [Desulfovibrio sp.]
MDFNIFYDYFLFTKSWAYIMMFFTLPYYVFYWNTALYPYGKKENNTPGK